MMAWTRTGTSLISFGFSIYKFADILEGKSGGGGILEPLVYVSAMIFTGLLARSSFTPARCCSVATTRASSPVKIIAEP